MKNINRKIAVLIFLFSQTVFGENWRVSGNFLLPVVSGGGTELASNLRIVTIKNSNATGSSVLHNVAVAYVEGSATFTITPRPIRVKRLEHYNGGGPLSGSADSWIPLGNAGFTQRGFSFTGYADLDEYNYEIGGTGLTTPILGCFNAPCSGFQTLGVTSGVLPQIDPTSAFPSSKSYTDMISDFTHDYFAYPDQTQSGKVTVVRREHSSAPISDGVWQVVGQAGFSDPGSVAHVRLALKPGGTLRVVVGTENGSASSLEVFKLVFIGLPHQPQFPFWIQEGNTILTQHVIQQFSTDPNTKFYARPDLEVNASGVPFLLFTRRTAASEGGMTQSTVKTLSENQWVTLGDVFLGNPSDRDQVCTDMTFNTFNDRLHVGCIALSERIPVVRSFSSGRWNTVGDIVSETGLQACAPFAPPPDTSITHDRATNALFFAYSACGNSPPRNQVVVVSKDLD